LCDDADGYSSELDDTNLSADASATHETSDPSHFPIQMMEPSKDATPQPCVELSQATAPRGQGWQNLPMRTFFKEEFNNLDRYIDDFKALDVDVDL